MRLVPIRKANMAPNTWADKLALREHRKAIETVNSQLEAMGVQRLHARTTAGLEVKVQASLLALTCANANYRRSDKDLESASGFGASHGEACSRSFPESL